MEKQISNLLQNGRDKALYDYFIGFKLHLNCLCSKVGSTDWMLNKSQAIFIDIL